MAVKQGVRAGRRAQGLTNGWLSDTKGVVKVGSMENAKNEEENG